MATTARSSLRPIVSASGSMPRVIASTDCGFGAFAAYTMVAEDVCWSKRRMLSDGARLASQRF